MNIQPIGVSNQVNCRKNEQNTTFGAYSSNITPKSLSNVVTACNPNRIPAVIKLLPKVLRDFFTEKIIDKKWMRNKGGVLYKEIEHTLATMKNRYSEAKTILVHTFINDEKHISAEISTVLSKEQSRYVSLIPSETDITSFQTNVYKEVLNLKNKKRTK